MRKSCIRKKCFDFISFLFTHFHVTCESTTSVNGIAQRKKRKLEKVIERYHLPNYKLSDFVKDLSDLQENSLKKDICEIIKSLHNM